MDLRTSNTGSKNSSIQKWLQERQQLLLIFTNLTKTQPFADEYIENESTLLKEFCQILLDYISYGHFNIYAKLNLGISNTDAINNKIRQNLLITTDAALEFSNKYTENIENTINLKKDLSKLGVILSEHLELEDKLIYRFVKINRNRQKSRTN